MSVKIMSAVFAADIGTLEYIGADGKQHRLQAHTAKIVLLAYADHANDDWRAAYPGYTLLERKTGLSRQGLANAIRALRQNEYLIPEGESTRGTNSYIINRDALLPLVNGVDQGSQRRGLGVVNGVDQGSQRRGLGVVNGVDQGSQRRGLKPSFNHPSNHPLTADGGGQENPAGHTESVYSVYEANIGPLTPMIADALDDAESEYPLPWILDAIQIAVERNARNWRYIEAILRRWQAEGKDSGKHPPAAAASGVEEVH